ncbi:MAG: Oxidoreductase, short-chain dehydrogenase/reductase family, partial [uncultured Rubrobacteraceae bacterium]
AGRQSCPDHRGEPGPREGARARLRERGSQAGHKLPQRGGHPTRRQGGRGSRRGGARRRGGRIEGRGRAEARGGGGREVRRDRRSHQQRRRARTQGRHRGVPGGRVAEGDRCEPHRPLPRLEGCRPPPARGRLHNKRRQRGQRRGPRRVGRVLRQQVRDGGPLPDPGRRARRPRRPLQRRGPRRHAHRHARRSLPRRRPPDPHHPGREHGRLPVPRLGRVRRCNRPALQGAGVHLAAKFL